MKFNEALNSLRLNIIVLQKEATKRFISALFFYQSEETMSAPLHPIACPKSKKPMLFRAAILERGCEIPP
ncbi:hypothetical protein QWY14_08175 [Planococcus sp. N028]|uniref:Transposase n=1 Tax=Planococcus shixiaomingii TaxID=3058393 RepID=A0ABT8N1J8_9BACL|nr:hypothetical protein [Planococcus sp. N028]MDN7241768.1 hypothetical protein [Planococcus sp. N028]